MYGAVFLSACIAEEATALLRKMSICSPVKIGYGYFLLTVL